MNKILRYSFLMLLSFICGGMNAGTIDFSTLGLENGVQYTTPFDGSDFTVTFGGGANDGKYYTTGTAIRVYGGGTMTIAAKSGNLTKLVITYDGSNKPADGTVVDGGTYDAETGTWTGSASSVVFTRPSGSGHWRVQKVEATVGAGSGKTATTINFAEGYKTKIGKGPDEMFPELGSFVALPTATVKAGDAVVSSEVEWTLDLTSWDGKEGKEQPSINDGKINNLNNGSGLITVKASYAGSETYEASTKSYDLKVYSPYGLLSEMVGDIFDPTFEKDDMNDKDGKPVFYFFRNIDAAGIPVVTNTVTFVSGNYIYLTDGTANLLFYGNNSQNLKKGDVISGNVSDTNLGGFWGNLKRYNKLPEFAFTDMNVKVESEGATVTPKTIKIDELAANINNYVKVENAEFVSASGKNLTFKVGETTLAVYNQFSVDATTLEATAMYTIEAMGSVYKKNKDTDAVYQLYPISFTKQGGGSGAIYSWESPEGTAAETGGTATFEMGDEGENRVNYKNTAGGVDYYTLCLNGNKANIEDETYTKGKSERIKVTLEKALAGGETISVTAYTNKGDESKISTPYFKFSNGTELFDDSKTYIDLGISTNTAPVTQTYTIPAEAAGSTSFKMSRSKTGTNLFIAKFVITSGGSTGINTVKTVRIADGAIYNLAGQKVDKSYKGVVIMNGKKMIQK